MRIVVQRVKQAAVSVRGEIAGPIGVEMESRRVNDGPITIASDSRDPR